MIDHSNMGVSTQFIEQERVLGGTATVAQQLGDSEVTEAALQVFNDFVQQIARINPSTAMMKEKPQICRTQERRSERFMKPLDAVLAAAAPLPQPMAQKVLGLPIAFGFSVPTVAADAGTGGPRL